MNTTQEFIAGKNNVSLDFLNLQLRRNTSLCGTSNFSRFRCTPSSKCGFIITDIKSSIFYIFSFYFKKVIFRVVCNRDLYISVAQVFFLMVFNFRKITWMNTKYIFITRGKKTALDYNLLIHNMLALLFSKLPNVNKYVTFKHTMLLFNICNFCFCITHTSNALVFLKKWAMH